MAETLVKMVKREDADLFMEEAVHGLGAQLSLVPAEPPVEAPDSRSMV